jgi:hypothetical protein
MPYSQKIRTAIDRAPKTMGSKLGKWAVVLDFSVSRVAFATGATRQTVYNWFSGGEVTPAYRERVQALIDLMASSSTADEAWRKACQQFNLVA